MGKTTNYVAHTNHTLQPNAPVTFEMVPVLVVEAMDLRMKDLKWQTVPLRKT